MQHILIPLAISQAHPPINCLLREFVGESMGTTWAVRFIDTSGLKGLDWQAGIQSCLDKVVAQMSHWHEDSNLGRYNAASPSSWHVLPDEFAAVIRCALTVAEQSGGAYDPTAGALVDLWGFGPRGGYATPDFELPSAAAVASALADCGWQRLQFDSTQRIFQPGGLRLDLSSIAKGYSVDLLAHYLHAHALDHFLVEVGGELRGAGMKPDGQPWWVGLEHPQGDEAQATLAALHGLSLATSGDYRRYLMRNGQRYAHTLDPRSGYPLTTDLASVTVLHAECMLADAWSTALSVMGLDEALVCADRLGLAARFLVREATAHREYRSAAYSEMLQ